VSMPPPWIVHLRFGNIRREEFHRFLASVWPHKITRDRNNQNILA
jgi:hypothetical protein